MIFIYEVAKIYKLNKTGKGRELNKGGKHGRKGRKDQNECRAGNEGALLPKLQSCLIQLKFYLIECYW